MEHDFWDHGVLLPFDKFQPTPWQWNPPPTPDSSCLAKNHTGRPQGHIPCAVDTASNGWRSVVDTAGKPAMGQNMSRPSTSGEHHNSWYSWWWRLVPKQLFYNRFLSTPKSPSKHQRSWFTWKKSALFAVQFQLCCSWHLCWHFLNKTFFCGVYWVDLSFGSAVAPPHSTLYTLVHFTLHTLHVTLHTLHCTLHVWPFATLHFALHTRHFTKIEQTTKHEIENTPPASARTPIKSYYITKVGFVSHFFLAIAPLATNSVRVEKNVSYTMCCQVYWLLSRRPRYWSTNKWLRCLRLDFKRPMCSSCSQTGFCSWTNTFHNLFTISSPICSTSWSRVNEVQTRATCLEISSSPNLMRGYLCGFHANESEKICSYRYHQKTRTQSAQTRLCGPFC